MQLCMCWKLLILGHFPSHGAFLVAQRVKNIPGMQETQVRSLGWKDTLDKGMATHSNSLAQEIPWTEEPGGIQSTGPQRVRHDWATNTFPIMGTLDWTVVFLSGNIWGGGAFLFLFRGQEDRPLQRGVPSLDSPLSCRPNALSLLAARKRLDAFLWFLISSPSISWQNSVSLWLASFWTPRPNLLVTPGISWLSTFAFQSPIMRSTSFLGVSSRRSYRSSRILPREHTGHSKHPHPITQEKSLHMDTTRWSILKPDCLYSL